ncbi:hypothetical protein BN2537_10653 [Streptomyces venezuelae]|nr:hypothetical protein BN2537_10653 [Streptomyces venezuelae]
MVPGVPVLCCDPSGCPTHFSAAGRVTGRSSTGGTCPELVRKKTLRRA